MKFLFCFIVLAVSGSRLEQLEVRKHLPISISKLRLQLSFEWLAVGFEAKNPVDSQRGAKVRSFYGETRLVVNFFFDFLFCPAPFVLGVQKYAVFLWMQGII